MFFDIAIIGSTWLRLDREQRRRGWVCSLVLFPACGVACPAAQSEAKAKVPNRSNC